MNEDLLFRREPHSLEGEQAVLGSMLIDRDCISDVMGKLRPDDFYLKQNREIFETIHLMFSVGSPIDVVTVAEEMQKAGTYDEQVTPSYLAQLMEITPTSANVMEYANIVADRSRLRSVLKIAAETMGAAQEQGADSGAILDALEQRVFNLRAGRDTGMRFLKAILPDVLDRIGEMQERGGGISGLSTGLPELDNKILGLNKSDLILLAARPAMGKTALAMNIANTVAIKTGMSIAFFSMEMSDEQLAMRLLAAEAGIDSRSLQTGNVSESQWEKIAASVVDLSRRNILIDDNPMRSVAEMGAKCRRIDNLGLIIVDHLQIVSSAGPRSNRNENRTQAVSEMSRMLKATAKSLNVPVLCLSQLNRECEMRGNKRPQLSDLRESGAIEQDADIVMFLYRDDYYNDNSEEPNIAECIVAKNRHGETGTVKLHWSPERLLFSPLESRWEP